SSQEAKESFSSVNARKISKLLQDFKSINYDCRNRYCYDLLRLLCRSIRTIGISRAAIIISLNLRYLKTIWKTTELTHGDFTERNIIFGIDLFLIDFTEVKRSIRYLDASYIYLHNFRDLDETTWHDDFLSDYLAGDDDLDRRLLRISFIYSALSLLCNSEMKEERKEQLDYFLLYDGFNEVWGRLSTARDFVRPG
ncbi:MAG: hypothetical protein O7C39_09320, partial [Bacteroidetes bacterium]|nr:hypothetical protein [Bacteroidota bacterium]